MVTENKYPVDTSSTIGKADIKSAEIKTKTQEQTDVINKVREIWNNGTAVLPDNPYMGW